MDFKSIYKFNRYGSPEKTALILHCWIAAGPSNPYSAPPEPSLGFTVPQGSVYP